MAMKAGRALANAMEADIKARCLPAGTLIGQEAGLCAQYGVGVAQLRQAARILEARGVARVQRGVGGGLLATTTSLSQVANYMAAHLEAAGVAVESLLAGAEIVDSVMFRLASERMTAREARRLLDLLNASRDVADPIERSQRAGERQRALAELAGNPFVTLAHMIAVRFMTNAMPFELYPQDERLVRALHQVDMIVQGVVAGDIRRAEHQLRLYHRDILSRFQRWRETADVVDAPLGASPHNRPVALARRMLREIREARSAPGTFLGSEADLMARYAVSRGTWREALHVLEEYRAVKSRRGRGGGVYVAATDADEAMHLAREWLQAERATLEQLLELLAPLALPHVALLFGVEDRPAPSLAAILAAIAEVSGCPILAILLPELDSFLSGSALDQAACAHLSSEWNEAMAQRNEPLAHRLLLIMVRDMRAAAARREPVLPHRALKEGRTEQPSRRKAK